MGGRQDLFFVRRFMLGSRSRRGRCHMRWFGLAVVLAALVLAPAAAAQTSESSQPAMAPSPATDGPGALAHFDLARKDCLGTARNTTSRVWFTLANGVL